MKLLIACAGMVGLVAAFVAGIYFGQDKATARYEKLISANNQRVAQELSMAKDKDDSLKKSADAIESRYLRELISKKQEHKAQAIEVKKYVESINNHANNTACSLDAVGLCLWNAANSGESTEQCHQTHPTVNVNSMSRAATTS